MKLMEKCTGEFYTVENVTHLRWKPYMGFEFIREIY